MNRVRESGSSMDRITLSRPRTVRTTESIAAVVENMREHPSISTRHRSQELDISRISLRRILNKDLSTKAYKVQLVQELKPHES